MALLRFDSFESHSDVRKAAHELDQFSWPSSISSSSIDAFVYATGQSTWLLHDLRCQRYEIQKADAVDTS